MDNWIRLFKIFPGTSISCVHVIETGIDSLLAKLAELGFVAFSQIIDNGKIASGSGWIIPKDLYKPIRQDAILLKTGAENPAAPALLEFLKSPEALAIIRKYGYGLAE